MKKVAMMLAMLAAMLLVAAAPAMAQDVSDDDGIDDDSTTVTFTQVGDSFVVGGDVNTLISQNFIGDVSVNPIQVSGDQIATGDGNIQFISQTQTTSVYVAQSGF